MRYRTHISLNIPLLQIQQLNVGGNTKCRLINPSKREVGRVSKTYLNDIIADVSCKTEVNQCRNTATVINWFKNLSDKLSVNLSNLTLLNSIHLF